MLSRALLYLFLAVVAGLSLPAQDVGKDLQRALTGSWTGTLEYRDYSEAASSTKRVKLPSWLTVEPVGENLHFRYVYDDGPGKTVVDTSTVTIDAIAGTYQVAGADGKIAENYKLSGSDRMDHGRGTLVLTGVGQENKLSVQVRTTLKVGRNLLEVVRETGPKGEPLSFRHAYTLVRALPPKP